MRTSDFKTSFRSALKATLLTGSLSLLGPLLAATVMAAPQSNHALRFTGVSMTQGRLLQTKFPFAFERGISMSEADEIVRYLMKTGLYSNVEVVLRTTSDGPELLLVATSLRKIKSIDINGHRALSTSEIRKTLQIEEGAVFERKELIEAIKTLQTEYRKSGFRGMNAEVEFETPNDSEVNLKILVDEGPPTVVERIQIDSANPEIVRKMERLTKDLKGKALSETQLQDKVREMADDLRHSRFLTARILDPQAIFDEEQKRVRLGFTVENPWRYQFRFFGNVTYDESTLIRHMNLEQLVGTVTTPAPELAERLRRMYQQNGFAHAEIIPKEKTVESKFLKEIHFTIDEGPRVRIRKIEITGNISRQGAYYAKFIESSESDIAGVGYYNRKDIEDGIKRIEEELQNQGYLRAKVKSWRSEFTAPSRLISFPSLAAKAQKAAIAETKSDVDKRGSQATIVLNIDEGPLTIIRQIRFEGVEAFSKVQLQNALPIRTSEALRIRELNKSLDALKEFYHSQGYVEMRILNEQDGLVSYNENSTQATLEFQIFEGPKVHVGSIVIEGNSFTKDYVISREIGMRVGDTYTPELRENSLFLLQKLGLFSRVSIRTLEEGTSIAERTVIIEVEESAPGIFESGVGVAYDYNWLFRGFAGVAYRNLGGTGRAFSARLDPSYSNNPRISYLEHKITLSYLEPYILRDRNKGRVNLVRDLAFSEFDSEGRTIIQEKNELGFLIERDLTKHLKLTFTAFNFSSQAQFDRRTQDILQTQNIAKLGPLFEYDTRDNVFYPTKGLYTHIGAEYSDPAIGSTLSESQAIQFAKVSGSIMVPYRIWGNPNLIFATSVRAGYLSNLSDLPQSGVPAQEAFFLGGRSTLRGFQPSGNAIDLERVPNLIQLGESNLRDFYVRSESYYALVKAELRFPIYGDIHGAFFYDGGAVLLAQTKLEDPYRDTAGIAIRYKFAGGIVAGLEYGRKLDRKDWGPYGYESSGAYHLSIGTF
jgi:outer membrane protein assembly complex protein YaeT